MFKQEVTYMPQPLERHTVSSSMIKAIEVYEDHIAITFHNDQVYEYDNVPSDVVQGLIKAESVGKYFNKHIKGKYETI